MKHKYNFIDPDTDMHTQNIESIWRSGKWRNKKHRGTSHHYFESYLAEFMWRKRQASNDNDMFHAIPIAIAKHFRPKQNLVDIRQWHAVDT